MQVARFVGLSGLAVMLACGGSGSTDLGGGNGSAVTVTIQDFSFSPANITVKAGTAVRWVNQGPSGHTTTSDANLWASSVLSPPTSGGGGYGGGGSSGGSFQFTFDQPGTYTYHCSIHPPANYPGFVGSVVVNP